MGIEAWGGPWWVGVSAGRVADQYPRPVAPFACPFDVSPFPASFYLLCRAQWEHPIEEGEPLATIRPSDHLGFAVHRR